MIWNRIQFEIDKHVSILKASLRTSQDIENVAVVKIVKCKKTVD